MFVDAGIPDLTGLVVARVRRLEKLTVECRFERLNVHRRHRHKLGRPVYRIHTGKMGWPAATGDIDTRRILRNDFSVVAQRLPTFSALL